MRFLHTLQFDRAPCCGQPPHCTTGPQNAPAARWSAAGCSAPTGPLPPGQRWRRTRFSGLHTQRPARPDTQIRQIVHGAPVRQIRCPRGASQSPGGHAPPARQNAARHQWWGPDNVACGIGDMARRSADITGYCVGIKAPVTMPHPPNIDFASTRHKRLHI